MCNIILAGILILFKLSWFVCVLLGTAFGILRGSMGSVPLVDTCSKVSFFRVPLIVVLICEILPNNGRVSYLKRSDRFWYVF